MTSESKAQLRRRLLDARGALSEEERTVAAQSIHSHLQASEPYRSAHVVAAYVAIGSEVDTYPLLQEICARCGSVALPVMLDADIPALVRCGDPSRLVAGKHGVPEPPKPWEEIDPAKVECALVPGVGFDRFGGRLGRGGGFYDRLLPRLSGTAVGLAYEAQIVDSIELESHDCRVQALVTEGGYQKMTRRV